MFFSTDICVNRSHPLHTMWLLSCYLEDQDPRSRKKKISDNTLRRSDLVKIVRELTKMFRVDGERRGFALAMNSDMFHAVVFNLEFKAIDLLSTGRKLLATIKKRNRRKDDANQARNLLIDLDTNFAGADLAKRTCVAPTFPKRGDNSMIITMFDLEVANPTTTNTIAADDFGTATFEDIEALEANIDRRPDWLDNSVDPTSANILPPPHMEVELQAPVLTPDEINIPINTVPATPPNLQEDFIAPQLNDEDYVLPFDDTNLYERQLPMDEDLEPPVPQDDNLLGGVGQNDLDNIQVTGAEDLPAVDVGPPAVEVGPPAVVVGPPAVVVGTPADLASGQVDLPADGSPAVAARPVRRPRNKKSKLIVDEVTALSSRELKIQIVETEPATRVKDQSKPQQKPRSVTDLFFQPMEGFHLGSELGQYAETRFRSLKANKRRIEYSESSSDSETEEGRNINLDVVQDDDRELSSLRDGLRPDLSSIHVMSGLQVDDIPGYLQDEQELQLRQDLEQGVSELRDAPAARIDQGQLSVHESPAAGERGRKDSDLPSMLGSRVSDEAAETRRTSDILDSEIGGGLNVTGPAGLHFTGEHSHMEVDEAPTMNVTPTVGENMDVNMPQGEQANDDDMNVILGNVDEQIEEPAAAVDPYANDRLLEVRISGPMTSAGNLLDRLKDMNSRRGGIITFDSVCPPGVTGKAEAAVTFFNILKLQKLRFIECEQDQLTDPVNIQLHLQDGSEYGSVSDGFTASSD